jgi:NAD(P)-dependent dehydrogenase (short-subunit alcohol dehydrogenase family)
MDKPKYRSALIVGTGPGLSASLARLFAQQRPRRRDRRAPDRQARRPRAGDRRRVHQCNAADPKDVAALFEAVEAQGRPPDVVVYNASARCAARWSICRPRTCAADRGQRLRRLPGLAAGRQAHAAQGHGAIFLTGATAGVKGFALSSTFAMGKFALRGLAQSMARELRPRASMSRTS